DRRRRRLQRLPRLVVEVVAEHHDRLDEVGVHRARGAVGRLEHDLDLLGLDRLVRVEEADRRAIADDLLELHGFSPLPRYFDRTETTIAAASVPRNPPPFSASATRAPSTWRSPHRPRS